MSHTPIRSFLTRRFRSGASTRGPDAVLVEEPMAIRLDDFAVASTMRTPGNDFELAAGFCHAEGLLADQPITAIKYCGTGSAINTEFNVVTVETGGRAPVPRARLNQTTSACGICGSDAIDELTIRLAPLPTYSPWPIELLVDLPERIRRCQPLFDKTGTSHGAAAVDRSGEVVLAREDIGRHNAVDKIVGRLLLDGNLPATEMALVVTGRASFEMVQKAWAAGFTALVSVSGPSALAVATARQSGLTMVGFARQGTANLYSPE